MMLMFLMMSLSWIKPNTGAGIHKPLLPKSLSGVVLTAGLPYGEGPQQERVMIDLVKKLMAGPEAAPKDRDEELRLVAAALLFRAVYVDGKADEVEAAMVRRIVDEEFGLDEAATTALLADAETSAINAGDLYGWTRRVNADYDHDEKLYLMEKLWQVVLADDHVDHLEAAMMRRIAGLIYVEDADSGRCRQHALAALKKG